MMKQLSELRFDNSYRRLPESFYAPQAPTPLPEPYLVSFNSAAAELIDLDPAAAKRPEFVEYFSGNRLLSGSEPLAMLYAGHQFGQFVPQLGDGRAILLGEVRHQAGDKWDLHLKGAGQTPFARGFDGRAVLRSTIREYLGSEAMHGLGIPTTRALCIIGSDQPVYRETVETAAVLTRLAPSHVRYGSFEVFYYRGQHEYVKQLADYVIEQHYPELVDATDKYPQLLTEVARRTGQLIAHWQAVGFTHGVMNTDNMSILGITLDYGPYGFLDAYDPGFVPNHTDHMGRYSYANQPQIGLWNLFCLAQTLLPLMTEAEARAALDQYGQIFEQHLGQLMRAKLGLQEERSDDVTLIASLLEILAANRVDYTIFFRRLSDFKLGPSEKNDSLQNLFLEPTAFAAWAEQYRARLLAEQSEDSERKSRMDLINPKYILRNYLAQTAINRAVEHRDYSEIERLLELLRRPYDEQPKADSYADLPPDWSQQIVISCSS